MGIDAARGGSEPWLEGIEGDDARELIESDGPIIRVIAGPGSGKTTCLEKRIQRLLQKDDADPRTIFVGTFTRVIAEELKGKIKVGVSVSTIHSLAYGLLLRHPVARQGMELRFLLTYEEDVMLHDVGQVAAKGKRIHDLKKELLSLQADRAERQKSNNVAFESAVDQWLRRHRGMLIGDVIHFCVTGLENKDIPPNMFDHVVIDEYQDLTVAEQELVNMIWSERGTLTVLGDDAQSIYSFRFNHPKGITDFKREWPECKDMSFEDNWRCGKRVLDAANLMLAEVDSGRSPMNSRRDCVGELSEVCWETQDDEIQGLAKYIKRSKESFLVLVPRRFIGYSLARAIGQDARTAFTEQILEHPIARESFTALSLLSAPEDFVSARVWLGLDRAKGANSPKWNAIACASLPGSIGGHELMRRISVGEIVVSGSGQHNIRKQAEYAFDLIKRNMTPMDAVDLLFDESLAEREDDCEKRSRLICNLRELRTAAHEMLARQPQPSLADVVNEMRYRIATRSPVGGGDREKSRVNIMTLHSAKGLQADNVIIASVVDQFMQGSNNNLPDIAEPKRLLYVAMTRARNSLVISRPKYVSLSDIKNKNGSKNNIITKAGVRMAVISRCGLLPQCLCETISGEQFLANVPSKQDC